MIPWNCARCGRQGSVPDPASRALDREYFEALIALPPEVRVCAQCVAAGHGCPLCGALPGAPCSRDGLGNAVGPGASWAIHQERREGLDAPVMAALEVER